MEISERRKYIRKLEVELDGSFSWEKYLDEIILFYVDIKEPLPQDIVDFISQKDLEYNLPCEYDQIIWPSQEEYGAAECSMECTDDSCKECE